MSECVNSVPLARVFAKNRRLAGAPVIKTKKAFSAAGGVAVGSRVPWRRWRGSIPESSRWKNEWEVGLGVKHIQVLSGCPVKDTFVLKSVSLCYNQLQSDLLSLRVREGGVSLLLCAVCSLCPCLFWRCAPLITAEASSV